MMASIQSWLENQAFDFVLLMLLVSTAVCLVAFLANGLWRNSAAVRCRIWQAAFLLLMLIPVGTVIIPKWQIPVHIPGASALGFWSAEQVDYSEASLPWPNIENELPPVPMADPKMIDPPVDDAHRDVLVFNSVQSTISSHCESLSSLVSIREIVAASWILVSLFLLIRLMISYVKVIGWRRSSVSFFASEQERSMPVSVPIHICDFVDVPITVGIFRPIILMPRVATDWSEQRIQMVLNHELAHVQRHDVLWNFVAVGIRSLFWFQPLVWIGYQQMSLQREQACDDVVISNGTDAKHYASELLAIMREFVKHKRRMSGIGSYGALAISEPPLETRLKSILGNVDRSDWTLNFRIALWIGILFLGLSASIFRPFVEATEIHPNSVTDVVGKEYGFDHKKDQAVTIPERLTGILVDDQEKPVANAELKLGISLRSPHYVGNPQKKIGVWETTSNDQGEFQFSIPATHRNQSAPIQASLYARADGFVPKIQAVNSRKLIQHGAIGKHSIVPGRLLTGKIVKPHSQQYGPPQQASIYLAGLSDHTIHHRPWYGTSVQCKPDGSFRCYVPRTGRLSYIAMSENYAPVEGQFDAPEDFEADQNVGEIALQMGNSVFGTVLDEKNKPIPGVVVQIRRQKSAQNGAPQFAQVQTYAKTNQEGYYQLSPLSGKCVVSVVRSGASVGQGFYDLVHSDIEPPVVMPVEIELSKRRLSVHLNLRPAKTVTVSGQIKWEDGEPASGIGVSGHVQAGGGVAQSVSQSVSDSQGRYSVQLPADAKFLTLTSMGKIRDGQLYSIFPTEDYEAMQKSSQILLLENKKQDQENINWVLRNLSDNNKKAKLSGNAPSPPSNSANMYIRPASFPGGQPMISAADKQLLRISNDFYKGANKYATLYRDVSTDQQRKEISERQTKFNAGIYNELFELETKYRGDVASINAMSEILEQCCNWSGEYRLRREIEQAYQRAATILGEHYVDHENIWLSFSAFENAFPPENYPFEFVKAVQNRSPFPLNRCYAKYSEIKYLYTLLYFKNWLQLNGWKTKWATEKDIEYLRNLDRSETITKINNHIKIIRDQYAGLLRPSASQPYEINSLVQGQPIHGGGLALNSFIKRPATSSGIERQEVPFTELVSNIDFKVNQLAVGKPFPKAYWNDDIERAVAECKGQNVLVMITFTHRNDENFRSTLMRAKSRQELKIIWLRSGNVPVDPTVDHLIDQKMNVIYDQPTRSLAIRWSQADTEAFYLIDQSGILRGMDIDLSSLVDQLESLVD